MSALARDTTVFGGLFGIMAAELMTQTESTVVPEDKQYLKEAATGVRKGCPKGV